MRRALLFACIVSLAAPARDASALVWPDVPERVERALASPDAATRRAAARELTSLGPARGAPLVLKALGDSDAEVRVAAAQSAVRLRVQGATDIVLAWLAERDARLRVAACEVAGAAPSPRAVPALARALADADQAVRAAAAEALGAQESAEAVAPLAGKLDDPSPPVRVQVARSLARLGFSKAVVPLVGKVQDSVPEVRQAVARALGDLRDARAAQALLLLLRDTVPEVRVEALAALGRLRATESVDAIAPLALDRNPSVRHAALVALGRIGDAKAVRALVKALGAHEDGRGSLGPTPVREALVAAGPAAIDELTKLLARPASPEIATSAAWVLGALKATSSAPAIVAALRRGALPAPAALDALAGAGTAESVPVVLEFVSDPRGRAEALRAAEALLDPAHPDGRAVEPLSAVLRDPRTSAEERAAVAALLGRTGAPRAATVLAGLVKAKDDALRLAAIDALGALGGAPSAPGAPPRDTRVVDDALLPLVADADPAVRLHAAVALGASGGPHARRELLGKLDGGDEADRYTLLTALGGVLERHPDPGADARLASLLAFAAGPERDATIEALGRSPTAAAVRTLAELAQRGDPSDRRAATVALGGHRGDAAAVAALRTGLADVDAGVRADAAFALGLAGDPASATALTAALKSRDHDVAVNAAGAIGRIYARAKDPRGAANALCPAAGDARGAVRANVAAALALAHARCGDGATTRKMLADDASELARAGAARAARATPRPEDVTTLDRCVAAERNAEVARICREGAPRADGPGHAVTVFVYGETTSSPRPRAPYLLQYADGVLRAGLADRRGAVFDPAAPPGLIMLRPPQ